VEGLGRTGTDIFAGNIHFSDLPTPAVSHDEIVGRGAVERLQPYFKVLRNHATWCGCRVIHLIIKDVSGWYNRRYGRNTIGRGWSSADI
jgi:hypothetical protein